MSMLSRFATLGGAPTDPYWANVSYLLVGNGTNGTTTNIVDSSSNHLATTVVGSTVISTTQSKYGSGSVYFDGNGDYIDMPASTVLDFGTGDLTIEGWVYNIPIANNYPSFFSSITGWSAGASGHRFDNIGYANKFWFGLNGSGGIASGDPFMASNNTYNHNQWYYYTITRSGNTWRMFVDGVLQNTQTFSGSYNIGLGGMRFGYSVWDAGQGFWNGYLYDVRITKGGALYTAAFTPPTLPLTTTVSSGTVSLLTNMTNAGIVDNAMMNDLETVGNAQISTSVKKYGTGSMYFDGSGDYLQGPHNTNAEFGKGDFTVEFWAYIVAQSGTYTGVVGQWLGGAASSANSWNMSINAYNATNKLGFTYSDGSTNTDLSFGSASGLGYSCTG